MYIHHIEIFISRLLMIIQFYRVCMPALLRTDILRIKFVVKLKKPVTVEVFVLVCEALVLKNVEGRIILIITLKVK